LVIHPQRNHQGIAAARRHGIAWVIHVRIWRLLGWHLETELTVAG
jgi:hypothetical protein